MEHNLSFIITKDIDIKNKLISLKYPLINSTNGVFLFKNEFNDKQLFNSLESTNLDISKLVFTNKMYF